MRAHGHHRSGAVGDRDAGPGEAHLENVPREVAGRMRRHLVERGDVDAGGVVVGAEVRPAAAPARRGDQVGDHEVAARPDDRLGRLDHQLELQRSGEETVRPLQDLERLDQGRHLLGRDHLGKRDHEVGRDHPAGLVDQRGDEEIERSERAPLELLAQRLDADADEGRQRVLPETQRHLLGRRSGVGVFLGVGPVAVAVLEVDAEVLDRLVAQLLDDARVHRLGERSRGGR